MNQVFKLVSSRVRFDSCQPQLRLFYKSSSSLNLTSVSKTSYIFNSINSREIHTTSPDMTKALVLGVYHQSDEQAPNVKKVPHLTECAAIFDKTVNGKLKNLVEQFGPDNKGKAKVFYDLHPDYPVVSVVGLGAPNAAYNESEDINEKRENIRSAIGIGAKRVRDEVGVDQIFFDPCGDSEASAEGATLGLWHFDELKSDKYKKKKVSANVYQPSEVASNMKQAFDKGTLLANAQNVCRRFAEMPANLMTPTIFCKTAEELFKNSPKVKVIIHDKNWAESKKMGSFLSVAKGSAEPPKFLEIHYNNKPDSKPFVMVGKGITFDSGGISIKPASNMDKMRYDMGGAACVVSTTLALASLDAPVNVVALAPLCENLPSGTANKPGDVVYAMNGKSIQIDNTDAEGRLILADALCYAHEFDPAGIFDIATLTGAMKIALGSGATGVFTNSTNLYEGLRQAGVHTGDRVWRMPLWTHYTSQVTDSQLADCLNIGKVAGAAGSCTAAAFLSEFVKCPNWMHLDIAGVMEYKDEVAYLSKGMTGRPVRTLYHFINNFFKSS